jgi:hypothetical protein
MYNNKIEKLVNALKCLDKKGSFIISCPGISRNNDGYFDDEIYLHAAQEISMNHPELENVIMNGSLDLFKNNMKEMHNINNDIKEIKVKYLTNALRNMEENGYPAPIDVNYMMYNLQNPNGSEYYGDFLHTMAQMMVKNNHPAVDILIDRFADINYPEQYQKKMFNPIDMFGSGCINNGPFFKPAKKETLKPTMDSFQKAYETMFINKNEFYESIDKLVAANIISIYYTEHAIDTAIKDGSKDSIYGELKNLDEVIVSNDFKNIKFEFIPEGTVLIQTKSYVICKSLNKNKSTAPLDIKSYLDKILNILLYYYRQ